MIYIAIRHTRELVNDLEECIKDGSWKVTDVQRPFQDAMLTGLREALTGMDAYYIDRDRVKLNQILINAAMNFNHRWDTWLSSDGVKSFAAKTCHSMLLRFSKGAVKAWRGYLIDAIK